MSSCKTALFVAFMALAVALRPAANAVPIEGDCLPGGELTELCQRCAKYTKAVNAFALCCHREHDVNSAAAGKPDLSVRSWCAQFLKLDAPYFNKDVRVAA